MMILPLASEGSSEIPHKGRDEERKKDNVGFFSLDFQEQERAEFKKTI